MQRTSPFLKVSGKGTKGYNLEDVDRKAKLQNKKKHKHPVIMVSRALARGGKAALEKTDKDQRPKEFYFLACAAFIRK